MSDVTTEGVRVEAEGYYDAERSEPQENYYFFAYRVRISNVGDHEVQLISRKWTITDANGEVEHVEGPGVVGRQPVLEPGRSFRYTSFCPLKTPLGWMRGSYRMVTPDGAAFDAAIAPFSLAVPHTVN